MKDLIVTLIMLGSLAFAVWSKSNLPPSAREEWAWAVVAGGFLFGGLLGLFNQARATRDECGLLPNNKPSWLAAGLLIVAILAVAYYGGLIKF